jgi:DNA-binding NtrC family response regulator
MKPILVVDDEAIVRESIRDWLKDAGYQVSLAESGEEALKLIQKEDFSMMILDLRLPGMNGIDVLKKVKTLKPNIKSIVITAYPTMLTQEEASKLGAIDYLVKPVIPDKLEELIRETIRKAEDGK